MIAGIAGRAVTVVARCVATATVALLLAAPCALANEAPVKETLSALDGFGVNPARTSLLERNSCSFAAEEARQPAGDKCQTGKSSTIAGGVNFPYSNAVAPDGDLFVADNNNKRVEEFTAGGECVAMFGWEVNKTKNRWRLEPRRTCALRRLETYARRAWQGSAGGLASSCMGRRA